MRPIYRPEIVARAIAAAAERPRREIVVGAAGKAALALHVIAPGISEKLAARRVERQHFQDARAAPGPGNLFEASPRYETAAGGWRPASVGAWKLPAILASLGLAGLVVSIVLGRRQSPQSRFERQR